MSKIWEVYGNAINKGKDHGVLSADLRLLIAYDMGYELPIDTLYHKDDEMTQLELFEKQFERLMNNEPVEYIINEAKFLEYKLYVDPNVLIPRMETQELVANITERIMDYYDPRNYLVCADIGTGSGAIALALKGNFRNWLMSASDVSKPALEIAKKNFDKYGVSINTFEGKSLDPYIEANMNLDIIVSNPPYIRNRDDVQSSVRDYEPASALYLEDDNNVYEDIFKNYEKVKKGTLLMCFEIGYDLEDELKALMAKYLKNYEFEFVKDLNDMTRFLFIFCK